MVFLLWAHSGNGNRLESTYYHWEATFLWVTVWWGSRRKVGKTANMYSEDRRENLKKSHPKSFSSGCNISIQLQIEKSSLIDHYGRRAASLQAGAHLNRKNQISLWRCWNDINFLNQIQTYACNLQLRNITFTSPREELIDRTPVVDGPNFCCHVGGLKNAWWHYHGFGPEIPTHDYFTAAADVGSRRNLVVRPYPLCPLLGRIMHPHRTIPPTWKEFENELPDLFVHFSFQLIAQFWTRLEHGSSHFVNLRFWSFSECYIWFLHGF